jgi:hypothetical protein
MVSESTQRLGSGRLSERTDELRAPATAPLVRMEARATTEQRMEALLLALIERGVLTRADYLDALRRLLEREGR